MIVIAITIGALVVAFFVLRHMEKQDESPTWSTGQGRQIYLTLNTMPDGSSVSVAVDYDLAVNWTEKQFMNFYIDQNKYNRLKKGEAREWAKAQVAQRDEALFLDWYMGDDDGFEQ